MIIVQGVFQVAANERDRFLAESLELQKISRAETGCIEYVFAADPLDGERVVLSERWATQADLDAHIKGLIERRATSGNASEAVTPLSRDVKFFDATETQLR